MKKITLKISAFLIFTMIAFQAQAQVTEIVEGTKYTLRNVETGQYLQANGSGGYVFADAIADGDDSFNFTFYHHNTIDPGADAEDTSDDVVHNYTDDWNIQGDVRGIMRAANTGTVHTNFKYDRWNANGGHKTDKRWFSTTQDLGAFTAFRFQSVVSGEGADSRFLFQGTNNVLYNFTDADIASDATSVEIDGSDVVVSDGETNRSLWVLAEAVLSTKSFGADAFIISNPVNNRLTIKGAATSKVNEISLYSVLGNRVLSKTMNNVNGDINIDVNTLSTGLYIIKMSGDNGERFTKKIVKQ